MKTVCPICEKKTLEPVRRAGRFMLHRQFEVEVPADFAIPECSNCGARPISYALAAELDPVLEAAFQRQLSTVISADLERLAAHKPLYQWERELGLSKGYLSKVRDVASPSAQLVALIRLLANNPQRATELDALRARALATERSRHSHQSVALVASLPPKVKMQPLAFPAANDEGLAA